MFPEPTTASARAAEQSPEARRTVLALTSAMLRPALIATLPAGAIAVLIAWLVAAGPGALGAVFGTLLVVVSGWFSLALMRWTSRAPAVTVMAAALGGYGVKYFALLTLFLALQDTTLFDVDAFALTILGTAIVWTSAELAGFMRARVATVTPETGGDVASTPA